MPFAPQVAHERPQRRELARHRARAPRRARSKLGEVRAHRSPCRDRRASARDLPAARLRRPGEVLRDVALVGAHGVRRDVAVEPKIREKRLEEISFIAAARRSRVLPLRSRHRPAEPRVEIGKRALGDHQLLLHLVARRIVERRHDAVRDVRRLIVRRIGVRHVVRQRADRRRARRRAQRPAAAPARRRCGRRSAPTRPTRRSPRRPTPARQRTDRRARRVCHVSRSTVGPLM